jgi:hypothetical protein
MLARIAPKRQDTHAEQSLASGPLPCCTYAQCYMQRALMLLRLELPLNSELPEPSKT